MSFKPRPSRNPSHSSASTSSALTRLADRYRDRLTRSIAARQERPIAEVERDLDHVLALARLFRAGFLSSRIEPDATAVHRRLGVILHHSDRLVGSTAVRGRGDPQDAIRILGLPCLLETARSGKILSRYDRMNQEAEP